MSKIQIELNRKKIPALQEHSPGKMLLYVAKSHISKQGICPPDFRQDGYYYTDAYFDNLSQRYILEYRQKGDKTMKLTATETIEEMCKEAQKTIFAIEDQIRLNLGVFMKGASLGVIARGEVKAQLDELIHQRIRLASFREVLTKI